MEPQGAIAEMLFENSGTLRRTIGEEVEEKEEEEEEVECFDRAILDPPPEVPQEGSGSVLVHPATHWKI